MSCQRRENVVEYILVEYALAEPAQLRAGRLCRYIQPNISAIENAVKVDS